MNQAFPDAATLCNAWVSAYDAAHAVTNGVPTLTPSTIQPGEYKCSGGQLGATYFTIILPNCFSAPYYPQASQYAPAGSFSSGYSPNYLVATGMCTCHGIWGAAPPFGANYQRYFDTGVCVNIVNRYHDKTVCSPKSNHSVYPLTGNNRFDVTLGNLLGRESELNYDTLTNVPGQSVGSGLINLQGPQAFGELWQGAFHKRLILEGAIKTDQTTGYPQFSGVILSQRGLNRSITFPYDATGRPLLADSDTEKVLYVTTSNTTGVLTSFALVDKKTLELEAYDASGTLQYISRASGFKEVYVYSTSVTATAPTTGLLMSVQEQDASANILRSIGFSYFTSTDGNILVSSIIDELGNPINFGYSGSNLVRISWVDGSGYAFDYANPNFPWAVTAVKDIASDSDPGTLFSTYGYDANGYAVSSVLAGGVDGFNVSYSTAPTLSVVQAWDATFQIDYFDHVWIPASGASMTLPNGSTALYGSSQIDGIPRLSSNSQPAGSGCSAATSAAIYDTRGNITSQDDFNGNRSCYSYDPNRSIRLIGLEGLPSSKACPSNLTNYSPAPVDSMHPERISTANWNAYWTLKMSESYPKKIVIFGYNGNTDSYSGATVNCSPASFTRISLSAPLVCQRHEIATSDSTGASGLGATYVSVRTWSYTYDQYGQVLTATTPAQSPTDTLSHTTTYTYYATTSFAGASGFTTGDLHTVTNPLNQMTTYTAYDRAGRLLSSTDPNGTVTTNSYFPRGWLQSQTLTPATGASLTTTYAYWPTGLLQSVTLPDASALNYAYDAAHRLTDVTDAAGNKLHYVLDNAGNRTGEQISDSSGNLARNVARVFDALDRIQTSTGLAH